MSLYGLPGEICTPTRSGPTAAAAAAATSTANRMRLPTEPPHSSVLAFVLPARNWCTRNPLPRVDLDAVEAGLDRVARRDGEFLDGGA